jgi:hypothetical protein
MWLRNFFYDARLPVNYKDEVLTWLQSKRRSDDALNAKWHIGKFEGLPSVCLGGIFCG